MIATYVFGGCFQVVAWSVLLDGRPRSIFDIFLSTSVAIIISVVLVRRDTSERELNVMGMPLGVYLVSAAIGFLIFRITPVDDEIGILFGLRLGALVIAAICTFFIKESWSNQISTAQWRAIAVTGALALLSFLSVYYFDLNNEYNNRVKWSAGLFWLVILVSSFTAMRGYSCRLMSPWLTRFLFMIVVVAVFVTGVGVVRVGEIARYYYGAIESLETGQYDKFYEDSANLIEVGNQMGVGDYALERAIGVLTAEELSIGKMEVLPVLAAASMQNRLWTTALRLYRRGSAAGEYSERLYSGYNIALFETGHTLQAVKNMNTAREQGRLSSVDLLTLLSLQFRAGDIQAVQTSSRELYRSFLAPSLFPPGHDLVYATVGEILPDSLLRDSLSPSNLYALVRIVEIAGGQVFHPGEYIGDTGIVAPVDIDVFSGGGIIWNAEDIRVDGRSVSPKLRGYNLVVIEPRSGEVMEAVSFDTWDNPPEGFRMAEYLRHIPYGQIVVGAIRDEGTTGLVGAAKDEMRKLGVETFPPYWGSHCFIGIKGAGESRVVVGVGEKDNPISVGVLKPNMDGVPVGDRDALVRFLRSEAQKSPAGFSMYLSGLKPQDKVVIARL
jgi:hypothetical protein